MDVNDIGNAEGAEKQEDDTIVDSILIINHLRPKFSPQGHVNNLSVCGKFLLDEESCTSPCLMMHFKQLD